LIFHLLQPKLGGLLGGLLAGLLGGTVLCIRQHSPRTLRQRLCCLHGSLLSLPHKKFGMCLRATLV
jgi:hypothetical protein